MNKYEDMDLDSIVAYINAELLKGRPMKDIEKNDFGVNERVIVKRLARKNIKRIDGQFVVQDGSKITYNTNDTCKHVEPIKSNRSTIRLGDNKEFIELKNKVMFLEKTLNLICTQNGSNLYAHKTELKIYSIKERPIAKTVRLYSEVWQKIDLVKEKFPHLNYQTVLNSLLNEVTDKYLDN